MNIENNIKATEIIKKIIIAQISEIRHHPNADRLRIVNLYFGKESKINPLYGITLLEDGFYKDIITAATNIKKGDLVPFLGLGEIIPGYFMRDGQEIRIEKRNLRGVDSDSMILSEFETGIGDDHTGIYVIELKHQDKIGESFFTLINQGEINQIN